MQPTGTFRGRSPGYVNLTVFVAFSGYMVMAEDSVVAGPLLHVWLGLLLRCPVLGFRLVRLL